MATTITDGPALARVAGLTTTHLAPLSAPAVRAVLDRLHQERQSLAELAAPVSALLHAVVPRLAPGSRRRALAWRRAVHAAALPAVDAQLYEEVASLLAPREQELLGHWRTRTDTIRELQGLLRTEAEASLVQGEAALRAVLAEPAVDRALALVSPVFHRHAGRGTSGRLGRKERLTAYRYAVRAALKTSPMSSLTELAVVGGDPTGSSGRVLLTLHPLVVRTLLRAAAPREGVRRRLTWLPNASLRPDSRDPRGAWMSEPCLLAAGDFAWSHDEVVDARSRPDLAGQLPPAGELTPLRLARHLESGLLDLADPCPPEELPKWLAVTLSASADPGARAAGTRLASAVHALAVVRDGNARERGAALAGLRDDVRAALGHLGLEDGWPLTAVPLLYEDRATAPVPDLSPELRASARAHAGTALGRLRLSPAYVTLVSAFTRRFGSGGVCRDVFAFCRELAATGWPYAAGPPASGEVSAVRPGRSSSRPCLSLMCQVARTGAGGPDTLVVNRPAAGSGGLIARFHRLIDGAAEPDAGLAGEIRAWLGVLYPEADLLEHVPGWEANPLQAASTGLLPALHWPTGPRRWGAGRSVDELLLVHDPVRGALELRGPDGQIVATPYLGTVPQHLVMGPERVLAVLADPWWAPVEPAGVPASTDRAAGNATVARRASWRLPAASLPRRATGEPVCEFLERTDRWRRDHGMPDEVFVRAGDGSVAQAFSGVPDDLAHKPQWLAFSAPFGLEVLAHLAAAAGDRPLTFTECLPGRTDPSGGSGRTTEYVLHFTDTDPVRFTDGAPA
ncbi:hypothetical protein [Streptomyces sp. NPDC056401]|uniref:hypothetical protein n=1 Tax=Streptomyces sp. NPDC056401 TaxID=3345809 RepID=UPI0035DFC06D